jgi:hypothetical protein
MDALPNHLTHLILGTDALIRVAEASSDRAAAEWKHISKLTDREVDGPQRSPSLYFSSLGHPASMQQGVENG